MKELLTSSETIISRSGYTTIMELISLGCNGILIPTPGQTEQEYLAGYMQEKGWFLKVIQKDIGDKLPEKITYKIPGEEIVLQSRQLLEEALKKLSEDQ
jgi:UDP-N-acetylglucosamine:LPS N-acetylglucosamine transferase